MPQNQPIVLLDQSVSGLADLIRDMGAKVVNVKDVLADNAKDDAILDLARKEKYAIVTPDRQLAKRCRAAKVKVVELSMEDFTFKIRQELFGISSR